MRRSGFTLIEVTIALAILALAVAVVVPAVSNLSRAELRQTAGRLAGTIRATYDSAALSGETHRLVFDFESSMITVEATPGTLQFGESSSAFAAAAGAEREKEVGASPAPWLGDKGVVSAQAWEQARSSLHADEDEELDANALGALFSINSLSGSSSGSGAFQSAGRNLKLDPSIRILDVWVEGMGKPESEGKVYLHFFPHGYTQEAVIHLENGEGEVFSVRVSALTGKTRIEDKYVEPPI